jgi:protein phosphatase
MDNKFRILSGSVSDRGLSEKRPQNEDSFLEMGQCGLFAVADGVGGAQAGEVASQMAMEILGEAFTNLSEGADAETVMRTAIERANTAIHQMAHELPQLSSMATTVVALHLAGDIATIGHVGDSRLYRVDRDGNFFRETDDHSMVAEEVRAGRMTEEQAENHPSRNIISRALGAELAVDIELKTIIVEPGVAFLICSDGITRHVTDDEIKGVLTFGGDPAEVCEYLKGLCYERGAEDNLTAVVVKVSGDEAEVSEFSNENILETDQPTIATARSPFESKIQDDDDKLLELESHEMTLPDAVLDLPEDIGSSEDTIPILHGDPFAGPASQPEKDIVTDSKTWTPQTVESDSISIFGVSKTTEHDNEKSDSLGKIASVVGMVLLGIVIGLGVYHYALVPSPPESESQQLSVMKSENIAFTSFEKNRRNVDADPAAYLAEVPPPDDAEDYYLIGRANVLVGDFPKARLALIEAQKRIASVEQANAKILNTEIATALVITNDPTMQNRLRLELNAGSRQVADTNTAENR